MSERGQLPDYPVVVIHLIDPPGSGLAACCGLPWRKQPNERQGTTLWACTGCFRWAARPGTAAIEAEAVAAERARIVAEVKALPTLVLPTGTYVDVEDVFDVIEP